MRRHLPRSLLLAAALALGQWLALAHTFEHPALQADALCQICAHAQGLDGGALGATALALPQALALAEAPRIGDTLPARRGPDAAYDIRGPPAAVSVFIA